MIKKNLKTSAFKEVIIIITLKSFFKDKLDEAKNFILVNLNSSFESSQFSLPTKIRRWTLLRGPHVNKKSREQLEMRRYNTTIKIKINNSTDRSVFIVPELLGRLPEGIEANLNWIY